MGGLLCKMSTQHPASYSMVGALPRNGEKYFHLHSVSNTELNQRTPGRSARTGAKSSPGSGTQDGQHPSAKGRISFRFVRRRGSLEKQAQVSLSSAKQRRRRQQADDDGPRKAMNLEGESPLTASSSHQGAWNCYGGFPAQNANIEDIFRPMFSNVNGILCIFRKLAVLKVILKEKGIFIILKCIA